MKKLLILIGLSAIAYWFVRGRLGSENFEFTEIPADEVAPVVPSAQ